MHFSATFDASFYKALRYVGAFIFMSLTLQALWYPNIGFDGWMYHLPMASYLWNIGGGEQQFLLAPKTYDLYLGYPKLAEWLQGAGWALTGSLHGVILPNIAICATLLAYAAKFLKISPSYLVGAMFAFPLIAIHYQAAHVDFITAGILTLEACTALVLIRMLRLKPLPKVRKAVLFHSAILCLCWAAACEIKLLSVPVATTIAVYLFYKLMRWSFIWAHMLPRLRFYVLAMFAVAGLLASGEYLENTITHGNPFYPVVWSIEGKQLPGIKHDALDGLVNRQPGYLPKSIWTRPLLFVLSITDIDWQIRKIKPDYSLNMIVGNPFFLMFTGGYCGPYVMMVLGVFFVLLYRLRGVRSQIKKKICRDRMILFAIITVVIMFLPVNHHLRYNMVWPMMLVICVWLLLVARNPQWQNYATCAVCVICLFNLNVLTIRPQPFRVDFTESNVFTVSSAQQIKKGMSKSLREAVEKADRIICMGAGYTPFQFRYSVAVIGGNHIIEATSYGPLPEKCKTAGYVIAY